MTRPKIGENWAESCDSIGPDGCRDVTPPILVPETSFFDGKEEPIAPCWNTPGPFENLEDVGEPDPAAAGGGTVGRRIVSSVVCSGRKAVPT